MAVRRGATATAPSANEYLPDEDEKVLRDETEDAPNRSSALQGGWAAAKKTIEENAKGFVNEFRFAEDAQVVKFLNGGEPIASYKQHWLDGKQGRKSYSCLTSLGEKCPLCSILGDKPDTKIAFSILRLGEDGITAEALVVGPRLAGLLEKSHEDSKTGPLSKGYWALSRTGKGAKTQHQVVPVKERDLAEDWDVDPAEVNKAIENIESLDENFVRFETYAELADIAKELAS
jgi:hypothetical protein